MSNDFGNPNQKNHSKAGHFIRPEPVAGPLDQPLKLLQKKKKNCS